MDELVRFSADITTCTAQLFNWCYFLGEMSRKNEITHGPIAAFNIFYHSSRVATMAREYAIKQGLSPQEVDDYYKAGLIHDSGKMGSTEIIKLWTSHERLTGEKLAKVRHGHVRMGNVVKGLYKMGLDPESASLNIMLCAQCHHVRMISCEDSYPECDPNELPEQVFVIGLIDAFESILSTLRPYKRNACSKETERIEPITWTTAIQKLSVDMQAGKFKEELFWKVVESIAGTQPLNIVFLPNLLGSETI